MDRGGLSGPDGPTHHGVFDLGYMRVFPNMTLMAPGDEFDLPQMLALALRHDGPCAIRYPKAAATTVAGDRTPVEFGKAEVLSHGQDGTIVCVGGLLVECLSAASALEHDGLTIGVVNSRSVKPLDVETIVAAIGRSGFVVTVEEGALMGGFGSAVLEAVSEAGDDTSRVRRLGIPDQFIEHGERGELLADLGLDAAGIAATCRSLARNTEKRGHSTFPAMSYEKE
jgi:1-deoxy-D-xylulose-5-phosphate synthase